MDKQPKPVRIGSDVSCELIIGEMVRRWTSDQGPGSERLAERAADLAVGAYEDGASVAEACELARHFVESWLLHPSRPPRDRHLLRGAC